MTKSNAEELNKHSLDELLQKYPFEELVKKYSLEQLEKRFGIDKILDQFPDVKEDPEVGEKGVLSDHKIERYVKAFRLICPFDPDNNLKAASYYLSLGDEYASGGDTFKLYDEPNKNELRIPPFEVAIVKTKEIINMPRFLIGRWNIRVTTAYQGLLWVGGPQVDPGWVGHLFCPIYNLSDQAVKLEKGDPIATIDFVKTTTFDKDEINKYLFPRPPVRKTIKDYNWRLKSALVTDVKVRISELENKANSLGTKLDRSIGIIFTVLAIIIAALSIFIFIGQNSAPVSGWIYLTIGISIIALILSICALAKARHGRKR